MFDCLSTQQKGMLGSGHAKKQDFLAAKDRIERKNRSF